VIQADCKCCLNNKPLPHLFGEMHDVGTKESVGNHKHGAFLFGSEYIGFNVKRVMHEPYLSILLYNCKRKGRGWL